MKGTIEKNRKVLVTDGASRSMQDLSEIKTHFNKEKLKKLLIYGFMFIVFVGCMYLIFKPSESKITSENIGLNDVVPQASETGLLDDKGKAYEQEMFQQKNEEKQNALTSLSDYWNTESEEKQIQEFTEQQSNYTYRTNKNSERYANANLNSYRNVQTTLGSFYQEDQSEVIELRRQLDDLKEQLSEKEVPKTASFDDQLALMEKSYQMAAKYLPSGSQTEKIKIASKETPNANPTKQEEHFMALISSRKNTVSTLYREPTDSVFLEDWNKTKNRIFLTVGSNEEVVQPRNSIRACIDQTQTVIGEAAVRLRLLESAQTDQRIIPQGSIIIAHGKFQGGRLQLKITSVESEGNIFPVDITIYDLDGQPGLFVPFSPEVNALTEMAGNMTQTSGTSIMMTQNAEQQVAADLSRGIVQGISGYFSKKVRTPKVTLKAGHQVFLVSKK